MARSACDCRSELVREAVLHPSPNHHSRTSSLLQTSPDAIRRRGFTLIELLVVLSIVALLLTLALPRYFQSIETSKETILRENLRIVRETIDKFYGDTGRYPDSLEELVEKKYLRRVPNDPFTENNTAWTLLPPEDTDKGRVFDIKSAAQGGTRDGRPFSEL